MDPLVRTWVKRCLQSWQVVHPRVAAMVAAGTSIRCLVAPLSRHVLRNATTWLASLSVNDISNLFASDLAAARRGLDFVRLTVHGKCPTLVNAERAPSALLASCATWLIAIGLLVGLLVGSQLARFICPVEAANPVLEAHNEEVDIITRNIYSFRTVEDNDINTLWECCPTFMLARWRYFLGRAKDRWEAATP